MLVTVVLLALVATACAGGLSGEIDGDSVPSFTSSAVADVEFGGVDSAVAVWTSAGDACADFAAQVKIQTDADSAKEAAEDTEDYAKEHLPEDYWTLTLFVGGRDFDDLEDEDQEIEIDDPDEDLGATIQVCHIKDYPQEKNGLLDTDQDCWGATDGTVFIGHEGKGALHISTDDKDQLEVTESDGDDDFDDLSFSGSASYCKDLENALDDLFEAPPESDGR